MANGVASKLFDGFEGMTNFELFRETVTLWRESYVKQIQDQKSNIYWTLLNDEDRSRFVPKASAMVSITTARSEHRLMIVVSLGVGKYQLILQDEDNSTFALPDNLATEVGEMVFGKPASFFVERLLVLKKIGE